MRTITEFFAAKLKAIEGKMDTINEEATKSATEALKAEGKSDEEVQAALPEAIKAAVAAKLGEETKLEGDKLAMLHGAIEASKGGRGTLKRVIVMAPSAEGEKAPAGAKEIDGKFYVAEYFSETKMSQAPAREERGGRGGRDGKRGGRDGKGRGGRDGKPGGDRGGRGPRSDAPAGASMEGASSDGRRDRAPRAPAEPYKGPNRIQLKGGASAPSTPASGAESSGAASTEGAN
jgi:hypothetical protein